MKYIPKWLAYPDDSGLDNPLAFERGYLPENLIKDVRKKAKNLSDEYLKSKGHPPIDSRWIAEKILPEKIGGKMEVEIKDCARGGYVWENLDNEKEKKIYVDYGSRYFTNFTIAHEIGHVHCRSLLEEVDLSDEKKEALMDRYAVSLLMPEEPFSEVSYILSNGFSTQSIFDLCEYFLVGRDYIISRIGELDILGDFRKVVVFKNVPYFDEREPEKVNRDKDWRVYCRAPFDGISPNTKAEELGYKVENWEGKEKAVYEGVEEEEAEKRYYLR